MKSQSIRLLVSLGLLTTALGCGSRVAHNDRVEGTVTLDGVKLPGVTVEFTPLMPTPGSRPVRSQAIADENGHYSLTCSNNKPGAPIGKHRVTVLPRKGGTSPGPEVPEVYQLSGSTPLYVEVTADQHTYELKLSKTAKPSGAREPGD